MEITYEDALIFSLIKWEWLSKNSIKERPNVSVASLVNEYPLLENLTGCCGMCEYYKPVEQDHVLDACGACPLYARGLCSNESDPRTLYWQWNKEGTKVLAKKMYEAILDIANEYEEIILPMKRTLYPNEGGA